MMALRQPAKWILWGRTNGAGASGSMAKPRAADRRAATPGGMTAGGWALAVLDVECRAKDCRGGVWREAAVGWVDSSAATDRTVAAAAADDRAANGRAENGNTGAGLSTTVFPTSGVSTSGLSTSGLSPTGVSRTGLS